MGQADSCGEWGECSAHTARGHARWLSCSVSRIPDRPADYKARGVFSLCATLQLYMASSLKGFAIELYRFPSGCGLPPHVRAHRRVNFVQCRRYGQAGLGAARTRLARLWPRYAVFDIGVPRKLVLPFVPLDYIAASGRGQGFVAVHPACFNRWLLQAARGCPALRAVGLALGGFFGEIASQPVIIAVCNAFPSSPAVALITR